MTGDCASRTFSRPQSAPRDSSARWTSPPSRPTSAPPRRCFIKSFLIGEAATRLPEEIRNQTPDVPWEEIIGMRNIIAHGYFEVDLEVPWKTVRLDLPPLQQQMRRLLESALP